MNASERHTNPPNDAIACLIRIQQVLLHRGQEYIEGNRAAWPDTPVRMTKYDASTLIAPYYAGTSDQVLEAWDQDEESAGLLLVGTVDVDAPEIDTLLAHKKRKNGKLAYIDASQRRFRTPMGFWSVSAAGKEALLPGNIKGFLNKSKYESSSRIDCAAELAEHVARRHQSELFSEAVLEASGTKWPVFTLTAIVMMTIFSTIMFTMLEFGLETEASDEDLIAFGALFGPPVRQGQVWRMLSHTIVHKSISHLLLSIIVVVFSGWWLEQHQGKWRTLLSFSAGTFLAAVFALLIAPGVVIAGSAGGILGMVGAMAAVQIRYKKQFPRYDLKGAWGVLPLILLYSLLPLAISGVGYTAAATVAIGGFVGGAAFGLVAARPPARRLKPEPWARSGIAILLAASLLLAILAIIAMPK